MLAAFWGSPTKHSCSGSATFSPLGTLEIHVETVEGTYRFPDTFQSLNFASVRQQVEERMGWHGELAADRGIVLDKRWPERRGGPSSVELRRVALALLPSHSRLPKEVLSSPGLAEKLSEIYKIRILPRHIVHQPSQFAALTSEMCMVLGPRGAVRTDPKDVDIDSRLSRGGVVKFRTRRYQKCIPRFADWDTMRCWPLIAENEELRKSLLRLKAQQKHLKHPCETELVGPPDRKFLRAPAHFVCRTCRTKGHHFTKDCEDIRAAIHAARQGGIASLGVQSLS